MKMNTMKAKALILATALAGVIGANVVHAEETIGEKAEAAGHDAARAVKKGAHRVEEAVCMEGDVKCMQKKAEHRAQEAGDYVKDKAKEAKNTVDSDKNNN